jgi:Tfp pilus assembly ATPase PilU
MTATGQECQRSAAKQGTEHISWVADSGKKKEKRQKNDSCSFCLFSFFCCRYRLSSFFQTGKLMVPALVLHP